MVNRLSAAFFSFFAGFVLLSAQAGAASLDEARKLYDAGKFDQAIEAATHEGSPQGLILASETLSAKVMLGYSDDRKDNAKQARKWAESALESLPQSREAHLQYALAYAFETQVSSVMRVWRKKMPAKSKAAIDALQEIDPDNPRGLALLGGWHLGIVQKAGSKNGEKWFGANEAEGIAAFEAALKVAPDDQAIAVRYALALITIDKPRHADKAQALLIKVKDSKPDTVVEKDLLAQAVRILNWWDNDHAATALAEDILDGKRKALSSLK